jgi:hypothetical protein
MYGVITNTMYHKYMYAARAALGASVGLPMDVVMEQYGVMMATTSFTANINRYAWVMWLTQPVFIAAVRVCVYVSSCCTRRAM